MIARASGSVVVVSAVALSEKVPDPTLRPHAFTLKTGELIDLEETARDLVAAGYERVDQVEDRGQFAIRGGLLDLFPATEDRAVRVDLFGDEIESLRWFSTFTQRSLGEADAVQVGRCVAGAGDAHEDGLAPRRGDLEADVVVAAARVQDRAQAVEVEVARRQRTRPGGAVVALRGPHSSR